MDAKVGSNASYTWRSILSARDLLKIGPVKSVGKGRRINIWHDPWVSSPPGFRTFKNETHSEDSPKVVHDLITDGEWDRIEANKTDRASISDASQITIWGKLLNANIPPKIKHFGWRALQNNFPVRSIPKKRNIYEDDGFPSCGEAAETIIHSLFTCSEAKVFRSIDSDYVQGFPKDVQEVESQNLLCAKNLMIDKSIKTTYIEAIRSAQHFIYIENQYFLGSSYAW
uniref:Reverse transcriptase zinc-binding domain-containing protein n=1 Tax=Chenopodium quinoa TaxID=63459 RepID=A0A803N5L2_CHEQI